MALAQSPDFVRAFPDETVLIMAVELATLTFQRGDILIRSPLCCSAMVPQRQS